MLKVTKKEKESPQNLAHRFTKTVRQSGVLLQVRGKQFHKRAKSDLAKKKSALRRVELKVQKAREAKLSKPKQ
jgi:hypothetical protein